MILFISYNIAISYRLLVVFTVYSISYTVYAKSCCQWKITKVIKIADQSVRQIIFDPKFFVSQPSSGHFRVTFNSKILTK